ncbi:MAG: hypothetical protein ACTSRS_22405 [Candidatus Helarchaeota archaeon]
METHKTVFAKIYDPDSNEYLSKILLLIDLITPTDPQKRPYYEVVGQFSSFEPQLHKKSLILEINPSLRGYADFETTGLSPMNTQYNIHLRDSVWNDTEWFNSI